MSADNVKLLFVINSGSGADDKPWKEIISGYFKGKPFNLDYFILGKTPDIAALKTHIDSFKPATLVAVGGDGTVALAGKAVGGTGVALGIIPGGSANGMARELGIPEKAEEALAIIEQGKLRKCDAIKVNDEDVCFHLADIGLNARLIKHFDEGKLRGKLGYAVVIAKTLWRSRKIKVVIKTGEEITRSAYMVVLANASKYGTGTLINPDGKVDDGLFEIVIVRKLSFLQIMDMMLFRPKRLNPEKIEILHVKSANIRTRRRAYFQVDGECKGKVSSINAAILPGFVNIVTA